MSEPNDVTYRLGSPGDAVEAARIIVASLNDLLARQNRPPMAGTGEVMSAVLAHLARTDPQRFWVAAGGGRLVAFASAWVRGDLCFLSGLFVLPDWQGRGLGGALIERAMRGYPSSSRAAAVMSSAANPVSNRLYARRGMYALMPVLYLKGNVAMRSTRITLGGLEAAPLSVADLDDLRAVDGAVTALDRTPDHAWLLGEAGREGWLFRRHGTAAGYAYLGGDGTEGDDALPSPPCGPKLRSPCLASSWRRRPNAAPPPPRSWCPATTCAPSDCSGRRGSASRAPPACSGARGPSAASTGTSSPATRSCRHRERLGHIAPSVPR